MFRWTYSAVKMFSTTSCHSNARVDNKTYPSISAGSVYVHDYTMNCDTIYTIILLKSVCLSQVAILARPPDVSNCSYRQKALPLTSSRLCLAYKFFNTRKTPKTITNTESPARLFIWMKQRPAIDRQQNRRNGALTLSWLGATDPSNNDNLNGDGDGGVCACISAHACVCACVMCLQYTIIIFDPGW